MSAKDPPLVAIATSRALAGLTADDRALVGALERVGMEARPVVWDDPAVEWRGFRATLVRSCWDYHLRVDEFAAWVRHLEALDLVLLNPPACLLDNLDKRYLRRIAAAGLDVVPTLFHDSTHATPTALEATLAERGWTRVVAKPVVSASAHGLSVMGVPFGPEERARLERDRGTLLIQPFLASVAEEGELSMIFLDGGFSHAVRKKPAPGDFRVQGEHGGSSERTVPSEGAAHLAARALEALGGDPLYARVDVVEERGRTLVMEVEMVEPELFFTLAPGSADRLAAGVARRLGIVPDIREERGT